MMIRLSFFALVALVVTTLPSDFTTKAPVLGWSLLEWSLTTTTTTTTMNSKWSLVVTMLPALSPV
jgi:hypothetical protein